MSDADDFLAPIFWTIVVLAIGVWMIHDCRVEERRQDEIRRECKLVRKVAGQLVLGVPVGRGSPVVGSTDDQKCYACPNGVEECF